ncbi:hypothetical protein [Nocardia sp. NBC_00511]|uniref:hypothetical protein n=1 Tax=Nocardia sp. NBC_00511 TaxID=2903591 RepID=UPI0030E36105
MPVLWIHDFRVVTGRIDALLTRRAELIERLRRSAPGLTETRLTRLENGSYTDTWRWASAEQMLTALRDLPGFGRTALFPGLTLDDTAETGEIVDER